MNSLAYPISQQPKYFYQQQNAPLPQNYGPSLNNLGTFANFNQTFESLPNIPFQGNTPKANFQHHNFVNRGDLLHNNLQEILLYEEIKEYSILIDSKDRNYQVFPNPFQYTVTFSPLSQTKTIYQGEIITSETPNPTINDKFINVRYIRLEDVLLPFFTTAVKIKENDTIDWKIDTSKALTNNLYTILTIGEYMDVNMRSTNDALADSFATIYYDYRINETHFKGYTRNGIKIFPQDQLGEINKLKIAFSDPYGIPLGIPHIDKRIKSNPKCYCTEEKEDPCCFKHNICHPWNPIFQHHLHLKVGVVEPRLGKKDFC